jgi:crotonobetainyl-CoA:carnitine CoA-transferase CaiB-like acyl-CoA transferase
MTTLDAAALLNDFLVVDLSTGIPGAYATKLFADYGAEVVKVETCAGDPLRGRRPEGAPADGNDSALFRYLSGGKQSVIAEAGSPVIDELVADADLVVVSPDSPVDVRAVRRQHPGVVILSISPWGLTGPWAGRPGTEFIVQAESGALAMHTDDKGRTYQSGGQITGWSAGTFGAVGALGALIRARRTGQGELIDCSLQATATYMFTIFIDTFHEIGGRPEPLGPLTHSIDLPSIEPTLDGLIGFKVLTRPQFENFLILIERPDLLDQVEWAGAVFREEHRAEWDQMVHAWTTKRTTAEVMELAGVLRIPVAPVNDADGVLASPILLERGGLLKSADGTFTQPSFPVRIDGARPSPPKSAPLLGEHNDTRRSRPRPAAAAEQSGARPLEGIRVLDATAHWAGPAAGEVLAFLGADVVHIESAASIDQVRCHMPRTELVKEQWWERGGAYQCNNRNKLGLALALDKPEGQSVMGELVAQCDVMLENFSPRVFDRFGFTFDSVREINPRFVYARMPAYGLDGPWRDRGGLTQNIEQITGIAALTGFPDVPPRISNGPCDPLAGYHTAFSVLAALHARDHDGKGRAIEVAMVDAGLAVAAEAVVDRSAYGVLLTRDGNRDVDAAPQGLYECLDGALALSVSTRQQWDDFVEYLGSPEWACDPTLSTLAGRRANVEAIDRGIAEWAATRKLADTVDGLVSAGIPAGVVRDPRLMPQHPHLSEWHFYESVEHPIVGAPLLPSIPFRFESVDQWATTPAPLVGQHNTRVLREFLGMDDAKIEELTRAGVIGDWPINVDSHRRGV